ncbi:hypothetical protein BX600DRAFT_429524 [Xylariales sp. PMI_506]|nr:hypothetical protein BX600DRAFT_429524 [Xylariales sp. PMI_506]
MATSFEVTRDIRSASQDPKRAKEKYAKWAHGVRPSAGCKYNAWDPELILTGNEGQRNKVRPGRTYDTHRIQTHNIVKAKFVHDIKPSHSRAKVDAMEELQDPAISRSLIDLLPQPNDAHRSPGVTDGFLYSFDHNNSPGKPLALDAFIKSNPRETEKLVEKEYEILDSNGDALKGRKARQNLRRQSPRTMPEEPATVEDDGFELV